MILGRDACRQKNRNALKVNLGLKSLTINCLVLFRSGKGFGFLTALLLRGSVKRLKRRGVKKFTLSEQPLKAARP